MVCTLTSLYSDLGQVLVEVCSAEVIQEVMMPVVVKMAEDPVPNVRFNVAKSLTRITSHIDQRSESTCVFPCVACPLLLLGCVYTCTYTCHGMPHHMEVT